MPLGGKLTCNFLQQSPLSHIAACLSHRFAFARLRPTCSQRSLAIAWRDLPCAFSGIALSFPYQSLVGPCVLSLLPLPADVWLRATGDKGSL